MLLSFAVAMASTQLLAAGIHEAAHQIATNSAASVTELAATRTELRHLEVTLDDVVERRIAGKSADRDLSAVRGDRALMTDRWSAYLGLPVYPGERSLRPQVEAKMARLARLADESMQTRDPAAAARALEAAKAAADELDAALLGLQRVNQAEGGRLVNTIHVTWQRSLVASVVAIAVVFIASLFTALMTARLVRRSVRALEDRARESEDFAGRVAHDLATPLTAAKMTVALMHETMAPSEQAESLLHRLDGTLRRATDMVKDLYRYAQAAGTSEGEAAETEVSAVVREIVEQVRPIVTRESATIVVEESTATVACRRGVLLSIVANLVENALKHLGSSADRRVVVRTREAAHVVRIEVEDSGPGIEPGVLDRIFEPYVRGSSPKAGLGLGLATVKRLSEGHGGRVGVRSQLGKGSLFWVELPKRHAKPKLRAV